MAASLVEGLKDPAVVESLVEDAIVWANQHGLVSAALLV